MTEVRQRLQERARQDGVPLEAVIRRYLLQGVLRRWSLSPSADALILRGGLLTQLWVGSRRRETRDIDFLALYPRDLSESVRRAEEILTGPVVDEEIAFDLTTLRGEVIWQETAFPGHRIVLSASAVGQVMDLQIDVGFDDPVVPPAAWIDYPALVGPSIRVQAVRPELLVAWKLDGLFDHGARRWLAKDLFDLYLLTGHCALDANALAEAIRVAFAAHADPLEDVPALVYSRAWWQTDAARNRWAKFRAHAGVPVPEDLPQVASAVAKALRPALSRLIELPAEGFGE